MSEYARKAVIDFCGFDLEVYMLPDGAYTLSQNQVTKAVDEPEYNYRRFLAGNSPEALPVKGLIFGTILTEGVGRPINSTPIKVALAYWSYRAKKGNIKAEALVLAGTEETLTRLADCAFGVVKSDQQYAEQRVVNFEQNQQILFILNQLVNQNQAVLKEMSQIKSQLIKQEQELKFLKPIAEEFAKITPALDDLKELKPLLEKISAELKANPKQRQQTLNQWLDEMKIALNNGQRRSLGRLISDFLKVGNLKAPVKSGSNYYPESMVPLIDLAAKYLI